MQPWFEDLPLDFTRAETREAEKLLVTAYANAFAAFAFVQAAGLDLAAMNQMLPTALFLHQAMEKARLSNRLIQTIAEAMGDPANEALRPRFEALIAGHEATFIDAALRRKPSLATLAALPPNIEIWERKDATPTRGMERLVNIAAGFADPAIFRLRLAEAEVRTARIDIAGHPCGTGFLVGDDLLLTNWHVVEHGVDGAAALFDHQLTSQGVTGGRTIRFAEDWLVASSKHDTSAVELGAEGPPVGTLDFALVRLNEAIAGQAVGPKPDDTKADRRGRYQLDGSAYGFELGEPLVILGHPEGRPAQMSTGSPSGATLTTHKNRVRYQVNTEGGSSGSPVFNRDWRIVALHHGSGPTETPGELNMKSADFNQGIPIGHIVDELRRQLTGKPELAALGLA